MLTDTKLRNLKPKDKLYKVNDRDGLYVAVTKAGSISFRYNYSINGRQETITFGRYPCGGNWFLRSDVHCDAGLLFFGQWLYNTGHGPKMKAIADKMEVFQNRLAGRVYKDMTRSVDKIDKMRRWPFGRLADASS